MHFASKPHIHSRPKMRKVRALTVQMRLDPFDEPPCRRGNRGGAGRECRCDKRVTAAREVVLPGGWKLFGLERE